MQVNSQVLYDLKLQVSSYLPTARLQKYLRAHYTDEDFVFDYLICNVCYNISFNTTFSCLSYTAWLAGTHTTPPLAKVLLV